MVTQSNTEGDLGLVIGDWGDFTKYEFTNRGRGIVDWWLLIGDWGVASPVTIRLPARLPMELATRPVSHLPRLVEPRNEPQKVTGRPAQIGSIPHA